MWYGLSTGLLVMLFFNVGRSDRISLSLFFGKFFMYVAKSLLSTISLQVFSPTCSAQGMVIVMLANSGKLFRLKMAVPQVLSTMLTVMFPKTMNDSMKI